MNQDYWLKQGSESLFPDLLWSRPENKAAAGKLLIIGGNAHGFAAPGEAYVEAVQTGVGVARVLLPDAVKAIAGKVLQTVTYAPSTPSGSFAQQGLLEWVEEAAWADAVLLAGGIGHNSETSVLMEKFITTYQGQLTITEDCLDAFVVTPDKLFSRPDTLVVAAFGQLQKMWPSLHVSKDALTFKLPLPKIVELLHQLTLLLPATVVTKHQDTVIVAHNGMIATTAAALEIWRVKIAASASVWWLQNPGKPFQAVTTAML